MSRSDTPIVVLCFLLIAVPLVAMAVDVPAISVLDILVVALMVYAAYRKMCQRD